VPPVRYELGFYIPEDGILHNSKYYFTKLITTGETKYTAGEEELLLQSA
jgi:hypothetical protein